jgi:hypothetical protein
MRLDAHTRLSPNYRKWQSYPGKQATEEAGLSKRQKDTAIQVANVPEGEFETQVESDSPPTVTALAKQGTEKRPPPFFRG